jgi:hypothetical protein
MLKSDLFFELFPLLINALDERELKFGFALAHEKNQSR